MEIEKRPFDKIPSYIHELMFRFFDDLKDEGIEKEDELIAQYIDMAFSAGWQTAKVAYTKKCQSTTCKEKATKCFCKTCFESL